MLIVLPFGCSCPQGAIALNCHFKPPKAELTRSRPRRCGRVLYFALSWRDRGCACSFVSNHVLIAS